MLETLQLLTDYTRWADARMFESLSKLTPEQWTRDLASSFRSMRDTVVHLVGAQEIWLRRWKGTSPKALLDPAGFPTSGAIKTRWENLARERAEFLAAQTGETLSRTLTYQNLKGETLSWPLGRLMLHVVNHSTYHRGQVTTLLRQLGAQPAVTDLVYYFSER